MAKTVLVVDDEKLIVKGIRFSLEQDGMDVDVAYDGEQADAGLLCHFGIENPLYTHQGTRDDRYNDSPHKKTPLF